MIDICPVGALTSKPFRYSARTWELSRRKSVSPHDSTGANLIVQVKNHKVMRVLPFENEDVNECWIADRDRFSYEALSSDERLTRPMLKQGGQWTEVDWQTALEYVANGLRCIQKEQGAQALAPLVSPHSTLEELYLAGHWCAGWEAAISITVFAMPISRRPKACAGWDAPLLRCRRCNRCWWWAPRCARIIRCLRSGFARRPARVYGHVH